MHVFDKKAFHNMVFILTISCEMAMLINYPILWTFLYIWTFSDPIFLYGHFIPYGHFPLWTLFHMDILPYGQFADSPLIIYLFKILGCCYCMRL